MRTCTTALAPVPAWSLSKLARRAPERSVAARRFRGVASVLDVAIQRHDGNQTRQLEDAGYG
jgi:hypothetical protein